MTRHTAQDSPTGAASDPMSLALFAEAPSRRQGRVRSNFSLTRSPSSVADLLAATQQPPRRMSASVVSPAVEQWSSTRDSEPVATAWSWSGSASVDWDLVATLRVAASEMLMRAMQTRPGASMAEQHDMGRVIIADLVAEEVADRARLGRAGLEPSQEVALAQAIFDALFRLGRLQPLVDDEAVENITILGCDVVWLEYADGRVVRGPAVAQSDAELIDFLVFVASRSEVNAREFSEASPRLHLRLDGGARLAATAWVTPRPSVVIRRHRLAQVTLDDLVALGSLSPVAASFLAAAVRARRSIVVAGAQGAGKTTMVRALCAEIGPDEAIGTFETEYELHLHEMVERHPIVHAWEARPGGEVTASGRRAGEFSIDDALYDSYRFNLARQIVGEVRGREVLAMLEAMQSGTGSLSTTHARSCEDTVNKLVTCAMKAGAHVTHDYAVRALAQSLDVIVHVDARTGRDDQGRSVKQRWTSQIAVLGPGEKEKGYALTPVFDCPAGSRRIRAVAGLPDDFDDLARFGFDLDGYRLESQGGTP